MTDPTPTRDEAVTTAMVNAAFNEAKTRRMTGLPNDFRAVLEAALASAPAPASGRVDSAIATIWTAAMTVACNAVIMRQNDLNDDDGPVDVLNEQGAIIAALKKWLQPDSAYLEGVRELLHPADLASLSPAATPVSEAEPVAVKLMRSKAEWHAEIGRRRDRVFSSDEVLEMFAALAKSASSPAGGDVVREAARGVMAAWEMHPGTLDTPKRLAKWFDENMSPAIIALRAALSQSTSAGRGE